MAKGKLKKVAGQKSWQVKSSTVRAWVTRTGGHLGPVTFDRKGSKIEPYSVAPWATEKVAKDTPPIIEVLRGDFFCCPFGSNTTPYKDEQHPIHGETANARWTHEGSTTGDGESISHFSLETTIRPGHVDKVIRLVDGHDVVYCQHVIRGMQGMMNLGHHAMLKYPEEEGSGLISTSELTGGQVYVEPTENPAEGGYSILKPGAKFAELGKVPLSTGGTTDLSRYPARRGFEDVVQLFANQDVPFAWTAVVFPAEGYLWFGIKDPHVLTSTLLWHSNGGRHYAPWSGRHTGIMGLEEITGYFHYGLAESAKRNPIAKSITKTVHRLSPTKPLVVNYIMGVAQIPDGFDHVASIELTETEGELMITSKNGKQTTVAVDIDFIAAEPLSE